MELQFRGLWTHYDEVSIGEINEQPSETQPDATMSLEELVTRFAKGEEIPVHNTYGDEDMTIQGLPVGFETMDKFDQMEAIQNHLTYLEDVKHRLKQQTSGEADKPQESGGQPSESEA